MLRVITLNVNGIRAARQKGFFTWLAEQKADFVCLQETKAQIAQLTAADYHPAGFHCFYNDALKPGYSGVAIYSRLPPKKVHDSFGWKLVKEEGRFLQLDFADFSIISIYLPSGTSGEHRQALKYEFMRHFFPYLQQLRHTKRHYIFCGDWNIAHQKIDLKNWRGNQKHSGFLPEERAWLTQVFDELDWVDAFRVVNQAPDQYTWWSHRGQAWTKNVGWRIDYQIVSPELKKHVLTAGIYKAQRFSDHAPLTIDYDFVVK